MDSPLLAQPSPLDDTDAQSVLVKPTRGSFAPVTPSPKAALAPVTLTPAQPPVVEKPRDYFSALQGQESGGNTFAKSKTSSAAGLYQFTDSTWRGVAARHPELGLTPDGRFDQAQEAKAIRAFTQDNAKILEQHDISVNPGNLYIMHFMGEGAGPKFLRAAQETPAAPAATLFPKEAAANPTIFFEGGDPAKPRSLSQVYALQTKKFGGATVGEAPTQVAMNDTGSMNDAGPGFTKMDLPPLPPGAVELGAEKKADLPPLPPGAVQMGGPEEEMAKQGWKKPNIPQGQGSAVDSYIKLLAAQGERFMHPVEALKGAAAGAAELPTGVAELLPNALGGDKAAQVTKYLETVGDPSARELGHLGATFALPAGRAAELLGGGIKAAPALRTALEGSGIGAGLGAIEPTGEEDSTKRYVKKAVDVLEGAGLGALPGAAVGAAQLPGALRAAGGAKAAEAAEGLRAAMQTEAGKAIETETARAAEAETEAVGKARDLAKHEEELSRIEKARAELAQREQKREAAGRNKPEGPTQEAEIKARVTARVRDRVRETEQQAKEAGLSEEKARAVAIEREKSRLAAEQATEDLATEQAARPTLDSKQFGDQLQKAANDYAEKQDARLRKESGFKEALDTAPPGRVVRTDKIETYIAGALKKTNDANVESILKDARERVREQTGTREVEGAKPEPIYDQGVNLDKADSLRKTLRTAYRKQDKVVENSTFADAAAARHVLNDLHGLLREVAVEAHPPYGEALAKYAEIARGGDIVKRGGDLKKIVAADDLSHEFTMNSGDVVGAVLSKTRGGSEALGKLIAEKPELRDAARNYFNRELFGFDGAARKVSPEAMRGFLTRNEYALKDSGLWKEFSDLAEQRASAAKAVETAKISENEAKVGAKNATQQKREVLDKLSEQQSLRSKAAKREELAYAPKGEAEALAKAAKEKARVTAERLTAKSKPAEIAKKETQKSIDELAAKKQRAEDISYQYKGLQTKIANLPPERIAGATEAFAEKMHNLKYIDQAQYDKMLKDVRAAEAEFQAHKDAVSHRNKLVKIVAATALGSFAAHEGITHLRSGGIIP